MNFIKEYKKVKEENINKLKLELIKYINSNPTLVELRETLDQINKLLGRTQYEDLIYDFKVEYGIDFPFSWYFRYCNELKEEEVIYISIDNIESLFQNSIFDSLIIEDYELCKKILKTPNIEGYLILQKIVKNKKHVFINTYFKIIEEINDDCYSFLMRDIRETLKNEYDSITEEIMMYFLDFIKKIKKRKQYINYKDNEESINMYNKNVASIIEIFLNKNRKDLIYYLIN